MSFPPFSTLRHLHSTPTGVEFLFQPRPILNSEKKGGDDRFYGFIKEKKKDNIKQDKRKDNQLSSCPLSRGAQAKGLTGGLALASMASTAVSSWKAAVSQTSAGSG